MTRSWVPLSMFVSFSSTMPGFASSSFGLKKTLPDSILSVSVAGPVGSL